MELKFFKLFDGFLLRCNCSWTRSMSKRATRPTKGIPFHPVSHLFINVPAGYGHANHYYISQGLSIRRFVQLVLQRVFAVMRVRVDLIQKELL